jgi:ribonuclease E
MTEASAQEGAAAGKPARPEGQQRRPRPERAERAGVPPEAAAEGVVVPTPEFADTQPEPDATGGGEGHAGAAQEGREGSRRRRRGGRGRRDREGLPAAGEAQASVDDQEGTGSVDVVTAEPAVPSGDAMQERGDSGERPPRDPSEEGQRRRGRRGGQRPDRAVPEMAPAAEAITAETEVAASYSPPEPVAATCPAPVEAVAAPVAMAVPVPQPVTPAAPVLPPFELPVATLADVAQRAGLEWVNSDAEKVRAAQAQMALIPPRVHVPREIKPAVKLDEGPLVLVETRKDLSQVKLPFEVGEEEPAQH